MRVHVDSTSLSLVLRPKLFWGEGACWEVESIKFETPAFELIGFLKGEKKSIDRNIFTGRIDKEGKVGFSKWVALDGVMEIRDTIKRAMEKFADNPTENWARVADHCKICGRGLSDDLSKARGVGPECWKCFLEIREVFTKSGNDLLKEIL